MIFLNLSKKHRDTRISFTDKVNQAIFVERVIRDMLAEEYGFGGEIPSGNLAAYVASEKYSQNKIPNFSTELSKKVDEFNNKVTEAKQLDVKLSKNDRKNGDKICDYLRKESELINGLVNTDKNLEHSLTGFDFIRCPEPSLKELASGTYHCQSRDRETQYINGLLDNINKDIDESVSLNGKIDDETIELKAHKYFFIF
ncbi:MAG: hypothetical protein NT039_01295 [Candidatus Berkelbacteria bacterium]|nr:hypothetical protein [Candidatus Berkelbacteria bacterium]